MWRRKSALIATILTHILFFVGAASTLQTYWNVFCLVRKKETGCQEIDPLVKSQMQGVRERLLTYVPR